MKKRRWNKNLNNKIKKSNNNYGTEEKRDDEEPIKYRFWRYNSNYKDFTYNNFTCKINECDITYMFFYLVL